MWLPIKDHIFIEIDVDINTLKISKTRENHAHNKRNLETYDLFKLK